MLKEQVIYKVGMYLRLSKDDGDELESESITNQRKIIKDYIKQHNNMEIYDEYIDDGYTGANFNRPDFKRLLKDIENKKINIVITKNFARLGRNYIETGNYVEKYFPDHKVRYIAILDNIDNFKDNSNNDFMPIKSVFNEKHCKDTSIAVKKTKRERMKNGFYACTIPPFGYKKDENNPGKLLIDEKASKTIKKIFELKFKGYTCNQIVEYLDKNKYVTPSVYLKLKGNLKNQELWRRSTVNKILCNKVYLGYSIRGKTQKVNYKTKKRVYVKRNDFIVIPGTHEPIISEEIFNKIHNTKKYGLTLEHNSSDYAFKNFIYCKNCGKKLILKKSRKKVLIYCRNYSENSNLCSNDCMLDYYCIEEKIFDYIFNMCNEYLNSNDARDKLYKKYSKIKIEELENDLKNIKLEFEQIKFKISSLYNQRLLEKINEDDYKKQYNILVEKRKKLQNDILSKENDIRDENKKLDVLEHKREILNKVAKFEKKDFKGLNLSELVQNIEVFKNEIKVNFNFT